MPNLLKQKTSVSETQDLFKLEALDFITAGVGCNCMVILDEIGLLDRLLQNQAIEEKCIYEYENPLCIKSALCTLEKCKVIQKNDSFISLTNLGKYLSKYIGLITIFFNGYGPLVINQSRIVKRKISNLHKLVNWKIVSRSSIKISENTINHILLNEFKALKLRGTICDLGCGHGSMLSKVCAETSNHGLGFESCPQTVTEAKKTLHPDITLEVGDITKLDGVWEDVSILMQAFVFHDFIPNRKCIKILNSYLNNFPNLKCFFYIDIVSPSLIKNDLFPGFDYIHGLLGIQPRTYEETLSMFEKSKYKIAKEISIPDLPNTFLWILIPTTKK